MAERRIQWTRPMIITLAGMVAVTLVFAVLAWHRRWISDDGLIDVRIVRNILAGNGPVFNAFERAEANTSTLWTWLMAGVAFVTRGDPAFEAVVVGWVLAVLAVVIAMDGARRFHRARGSDAPLVPAGALVVIGIIPFWDFATSGLESGLCTFWLAVCWWLLVALRRESPTRFQLACVAVFGLGPLVRPDFAVASGVLLVTTWLILRPGWPRTLGLAALAVALPIAYEIFRAGYYGALVPLPALAKGASHAEWERGFTYLVDYARPSAVWVPMAALVTIAAIAYRKGLLAGRASLVAGATTVTAALLALFVLRVGGDFMHGRMFLPPTFMVALPAMVIPWRPFTRPIAVVLVAWAIVIAAWRGQGKPLATARRVADERAGYVRWTETANPVTEEPFIRAEGAAGEAVAAAVRDRKHLLLSEGGNNEPANPAYPQPVIYTAGRLGTGGAVTPLDSIVVDALGLANPLGARIEVNQPGMTGHEKSLPWSWIRAEFGDPATDRTRDAKSRLDLRAARHAVTCGELAELLASVREPMTASRFWANLTGAVRRTRLEIPTDPWQAEAKFCTDHLTPHVTASSSYEADGWSTWNAIDGEHASRPGALGYSSEVGATQWITLEFARPVLISKIVLHPRNDELVGAGFPIDFKIQLADQAAWVDAVAKTSYPNPGGAPQVFVLPTPRRTDKVRIDATKLPELSPDERRLQLAEIEVE